MNQRLTWRADFEAGKNLGDFGAVFLSYRTLFLKVFFARNTFLFAIDIDFPILSAERGVSAEQACDEVGSFRYLDAVLEHVELIDFAYVVLERQGEGPRKGYPRLRMLLGMRSLLGTYDNLEVYLHTFFFNDFCSFGREIRVRSLPRFEEALHHWNDMVLDTHPLAQGKEAFRDHGIFFYNEGDRALGGCFHDEFFFTTIHELKCAFFRSANVGAAVVGGLPFSPATPPKVLLHLCLTFMRITSVFHLRGNLYRQDPASKDSPQLLGDLDYLQSNFGEVAAALVECFPEQLRFLELSDLSFAFDEVLPLLRRNPYLCPSKPYPRPSKPAPEELSW